jgi:hypothetical protein
MDEKQEPLPGFKSDPARYRDMSVPHANMTALNVALEAFQEGVSALRVQHKMRDVLVIVQSPYLAKDGEEIDGGIHFGFGNAMKHESQLAFTLGMVQAERQEATAKMMSRGIKKGRGEA